MVMVGSIGNDGGAELVGNMKEEEEEEEEEEEGEDAISVNPEFADDDASESRQSYWIKEMLDVI